MIDCFLACPWISTIVTPHFAARFQAGCTWAASVSCHHAFVGHVQHNVVVTALERFLFHRFGITRIDLHLLSASSSWRIWLRYGVHDSELKSRVVSMTALYTCTLVARRMPRSFQRRWRSFPNALVALEIRWMTSSSMDPLEFTLLPRYVKVLTYFRSFPSTCRGFSGNLWTGGFCLTPLICLGVEHGWWTTSVFLIQMVRPKALQAAENLSRSCWASSKEVATSEHHLQTVDPIWY